MTNQSDYRQVSAADDDSGELAAAVRRHTAGLSAHAATVES